MTDLISRLADALIELNNASPRLPRKDQIEDVLRKGMEVHDAERLEKAEAMLQLALEAGPTWYFSSEPVTVKWSQPHNTWDWGTVATFICDKCGCGPIPTVQACITEGGLQTCQVCYEATKP